MLTNEALKNLGLKSLLGIKEKYALGKRHILRKIAKKKHGTGLLLAQLNTIAQKELREKGHIYQQKLILEELRGLTSLVKKLEKRIANLEQKLVDKNKMGT